MTNTGIQPASPSLTFPKIMPRKAEIMPMNSADIRISPQALSRCLNLSTPPKIPLQRIGVSSTPAMMPSVMTHAMAVYCGAVSAVATSLMLAPTACAAASAAGVS